MLKNVTSLWDYMRLFKWQSCQTGYQSKHVFNVYVLYTLTNCLNFFNWSWKKLCHQWWVSQTNDSRLFGSPCQIVLAGQCCMASPWNVHFICTNFCWPSRNKTNNLSIGHLNSDIGLYWTTFCGSSCTSNLCCILINQLFFTSWNSNFNDIWSRKLFKTVSVNTCPRLWSNKKRHKFFCFLSQLIILQL